MMSAEIIDFTRRHSGRSPYADDARVFQTTRPGNAEKTLTATAKNRRLRDARLEPWRRAEALTEYWKALLRFTDAVKRGKRHCLNETRACAETSPSERFSIVEKYREALGKQLLTPAPDVTSVNWKRRRLRETYIGVKKELAEKAIADDMAFLKAHPTRKDAFD